MSFHYCDKYGTIEYVPFGGVMDSTGIVRIRIAFAAASAQPSSF